nr:MAG TPA: hypothetical protein [Caudoviricetes sp.]
MEIQMCKGTNKLGQLSKVAELINIPQFNLYKR